MTNRQGLPMVGSLINGWRVLEDDLHGRAGQVFIVFHDDKPDCAYALKMWRGNSCGVPKSAILRETALLRSANLPICLPTVFEVGEWHGRPYFVMERLEDVDWPLPDKAYRRVAIEAFEALALLHGRRILHCDITTRHLVLKNGRVSLLDLDNARSFEEAVSNRDSIGTDPYIAPEVASRGELSPQSDIYSLAYVLRQHCPQSLLDTLDPVFRIALNPDPSERPRTAAGCARLLKNARPPHHRFKTVMKWAATAATISIIGLGAIMSCRYWQRRKALCAKYATMIAKRAKDDVEAKDTTIKALLTARWSAYWWSTDDASSNSRNHNQSPCKRHSRNRNGGR